MTNSHALTAAQIGLLSDNVVSRARKSKVSYFDAEGKVDQRRAENIPGFEDLYDHEGFQHNEIEVILREFEGNVVPLLKEIVDLAQNKTFGVVGFSPDEYLLLCKHLLTLIPRHQLFNQNKIFGDQLVEAHNLHVGFEDAKNVGNVIMTRLGAHPMLTDQVKMYFVTSPIDLPMSVDIPFFGLEFEDAGVPRYIFPLSRRIFIVLEIVPMEMIEEKAADFFEAQILPIHEGHELVHRFFIEEVRYATDQQRSTWVIATSSEEVFGKALADLFDDGFKVFLGLAKTRDACGFFLQPLPDKDKQNSR